MIKDQAQEDVVNSTDKNIIVSASAGSGKTTVMIRKIVKNLIEDGIGIKDILVLTYTNSAAEEMKQRLLAALYDNVEKNPNLINEIDDLSTANISTIHSFFQKIIKKYFYVLNLDPSFTLCDELNSENLKIKALQIAMREFFEECPEKYKALLEIYGDDRTDKKLQKVVKKINEFCMSLQNPQKWLDEIAVSLYDNKNDLLSLMNNDLCFKINGFKTEAEKILIKAKGQSNYISYLNDMLSSLYFVNEKNDFFKNYLSFTNISFKNLKKDEENEIYLQTIHLRKKINTYKNLLSTMELTHEHFNKIIEFSKNIVVSVLQVYAKYFKKYSQLKEQHNYLDFNDLERFMLKLLEDEKIRNSLKKEFKKIYIDEYQDANLLQESILNQISNGNNRFIVGDVKQSIYAFRQASPEIFLKIQKHYSLDDKSESKQLNSNFRSRKEILNFVNFVFNKIMTPLTSDIDYKNTSQFLPRAEYIETNTKMPIVNIKIIKKEENIEDNVQPPKIYSVKDFQFNESKEEMPEKEAKVVAREISNLLGKEIYVNGEIKKVDFKDITILMSSRGSYLDKFCSVLSKFGIPLQANSRAELYSDNIVKSVIHILSLTVNYLDDVSLASSLLNFGELNLADLFEISQQEGNSFYEKVKNFNTNDEIIKKLQNFNNIFKNFKKNILNLGIFESLNLLYYETNFLNKLKLEDKLKVKKFTNEFLSNGYNYDVYAFLSFAEKDLVLAPSYSSGENAVMVTTIHASKGLEFPIVFIVNAGSDFTKGKKDYEIALNENLGLGLKDTLNEPSLVYDVLMEKEKRNEFAEKLRLFYVALTRAKNYLYIVGSSICKFKQIENDYDVFKKKSFLDLTVGCFSEKILEKINQSGLYENSDGISIEILKNIEYTLPNKERKTLKTDEDLKNIFINYFNFQYPYLKETKIALKNSVSRIVEEESGYSQNLEPKKFELAEHLTGEMSKIGTEYHAIMQKVNFDNDNLKINVKENVDKNKIISAINSVKNLLQETKSFKLYKEQEFMMYIPQNEIISGGSEDKILIQGIIDLISLGEKNIIIDYKLSSIKNIKKLIDLYKTQLKLYKIAAEKAFKIKIDLIYLYNFNTEQLIKIED